MEGVNMNLAATLDEIALLPIDERVRLVEAIWETVIADPRQPELTDAQKQELERRLADHAYAPDDVVSWEEAKAQALARIQR
jgi:putative addiction module component (TIGR02574 family)